MNKNKKLLISLLVLFLLPILACGRSAVTTPNNPAAITPVANPVITQVVVQKPISGTITDEDAVLIDLYQRLNPAVVSIVVYARQGNLLTAQGQGSGFVYDAQGHIITNAHVVHGSDALEVDFWDGSILTAELIGEDLHSDLAVIKVDELPQGVTPIPLGDIEEVAVGQTVVAIGNPFGLGGTLTRGIISALGRNIPALTTFSIPQAIQTDAPINPGNSGGPLLNLKGEVIGVNAQIETGGTSRTNSGIGFAIPVSIVKRVVPDLIEKGKHPWPWLGVRGGSVTPALVKAMKLPVDKGAYIAEVISGGPASKAGLRGASDQQVVDGFPVETGGDVIIAVDGRPVASFDDILIYIALQAQPGQEVVLTIIRDGKQQEIRLVLEERPQEFSEFQLP